MNTIENIIFVVVLIPALIAFIYFGLKHIRHQEEKYWKELENRFLDKKKE